MKRWPLATLLFATLIVASGTCAGTGLGTLAGTVLDAKGKPVAKATVSIQTSEGDHPQATSTDSQGRFTFTRLRRGLYDMRAYRDGSWTDWKRNTAVRAGRETDVTLQLPPAADETIVVKP